ncbi:hypothetical protein Hanom_Chr03g00192111 [Helianthus anomalus]
METLWGIQQNFLRRTTACKGEEAHRPLQLVEGPEFIYRWLNAMRMAQELEVPNPHHSRWAHLR